MIRWVTRLGLFAVALVFAAGVALMSTGHELGPRPKSSLVPIEPGADVQFITANAIEFGYIEMGSGPLVLLFHGYPETARSWGKLQAKISNAGYRTIAVYMRGYPPSSFADDYSIGALGKDVVALIDAFGETEAIVIGHDWGASAVYEAAFIAPQRIRRMIALSVPHPKGIAEDFNVMRDAPHFLYYQSPFAERLVWSHDFSHIRDIYASWSPGFAVSDSEIEDVVSTFKSPGAITGALGYYKALVANGDSNSALSESDPISVPALVIFGTDDGAIAPEHFKAAATAFTGPYESRELAGVGHFPQLEAAEETARIITQFLALDFAADNR